MNATGASSVMICDDYIKSPTADSRPSDLGKPRQKKELIGPKNNQVEFERILYAHDMGDEEVLKQTTLMVRNIPIKFAQADMLEIINEKFEGQYDYFYLPKDVKTQCGVGFAFINMIHPFFILDFFLELNCMKWSEKIEKCNSNKFCEITYANVQGIEEIKKELSDKNVMKKTDEDARPLFIEDLEVKERDILEIEEKYQHNQSHVAFYRQQLKVFEKVKGIIEEQKEEQKRQAEARRNQSPSAKLSKNQKNKLRKKRKEQHLAQQDSAQQSSEGAGARYASDLAGGRDLSPE